MNTRILPSATLALLVATRCLAQIPNGGFETWVDLGDYNDPQSWVSFNSLTVPLGGGLSTEQVMPGAVGASCAKVTTQDVPGVGVIPGLLYSANDAMSTEGFPWTQRSGALNGKWKYAVEAGDQAIITVNLFRWNSDLQTQESVGFGQVTASGAQPAWQTFSASITYTSVEDPDTALIYIFSSAADGVAGSTVWVDDLSFGAATGVDEQAAAPELSVFPSPATEELHVSAGEVLASVSLLDMTGREVFSTRINDLSAVLDVSSLNTGRYVAMVRFADGRVTARPFGKQ